MANGLEGERPIGAEFLPLVVELVAAPAVSVPLEPAAAPVVEPVVALVVPVPLERSVADNEREDDEVDGLGHKLLYTNCSGSPLQAVADPALNVPFG